MATISQLSPVSELINGVGNLVSAWRKPTLKSEDFASVLREKMRLSNDPAVLNARAEKLRNAVERSTGRFIDLRDVNNDRALSLDESGMDGTVFEKLDTNADGLLSQEELKKPALAAIGRLYPGSSGGA